MVEIGKTHFFTRREDWRAWLQVNYATKNEIWLIHYRKSVGRASLQYDDAVEEALCFGWIDGILKKLDEERYVLRFTPRKKHSIWSEKNKKRAIKMIENGLMTEAGLIKIEEAKHCGEWDNAIKRENPKKVPSDIEEEISLNEKAKINWDKYSPSLKKQFIWWIESAKREDTRRKRINKTVYMLEHNKKPGMN